MTPLDFILIGLAAWRLAYMLVDERGFLGIAENLRALFGTTIKTRAHPTLPDVTYQERYPGNNEIAKMLECVYCTSVWTAALMFILYQTQFILIVYWLALAGLAALIHRGWQHV